MKKNHKCVYDTDWEGVYIDNAPCIICGKSKNFVLKHLDYGVHTK